VETDVMAGSRAPIGHNILHETGVELDGRGLDISGQIDSGTLYLDRTARVNRAGSCSLPLIDCI
jgi:hypothetical protein